MGQIGLAEFRGAFPRPQRAFVVGRISTRYGPSSTRRRRNPVTVITPRGGVCISDFRFNTLERPDYGLYNWLIRRVRQSRIQIYPLVARAPRQRLTESTSNRSPCERPLALRVTRSL